MDWENKRPEHRLFLGDSKKQTRLQLGLATKKPGFSFKLPSLLRKSETGTAPKKLSIPKLKINLESRPPSRNREGKDQNDSFLFPDFNDYTEKPLQKERSREELQPPLVPGASSADCTSQRTIKKLMSTREQGNKPSQPSLAEEFHDKSAEEKRALLGNQASFLLPEEAQAAERRDKERPVEPRASQPELQLPGADAPAFHKRRTRMTMKHPTLLLDQNFLVFFDSRAKAIKYWDRLRNLVTCQASETFREREKLRSIHKGSFASRVVRKGFTIHPDSWLKLSIYCVRMCVLFYYFFYLQEPLAFTMDYEEMRRYRRVSLACDGVLLLDLLFDFTLYAFWDGHENLVDDRKLIRSHMCRQEKVKLAYKAVLCMPLYIFDYRLYYVKLLVFIHFRTVFIFLKKLIRKVAARHTGRRVGLGQREPNRAPEPRAVQVRGLLADLVRLRADQLAAVGAHPVQR